MPQEHEQNAMARRREKVALNGMVRQVRSHKRTPDELFRVVRDVYYRRLPSWLGQVYTALLRHMEHEDIVQECVCKSWARFNSFDPDKSPFRVWLCAIAKSHAIDLYRAYKADKRSAHVRPLFEEDHKPDDTPLHHLLRIEAVNMLKDLVNDSQLLKLSIDENLSCREIADIMQVSKSTANVHVNKAIEKARESWKDYQSCNEHTNLIKQ